MSDDTANQEQPVSRRLGSDPELEREIKAMRRRSAARNCYAVVDVNGVTQIRFFKPGAYD